MKSIKRGRGPSGMSAMGSVIVVIFGIFWTIMVASMGAPVFFPIFGVLFVIMGAVQAVYHFKNATGENRYSEYDIVDHGEEPDPLEQRFGEYGEYREGGGVEGRDTGEDRYCPYCGREAEGGYEFCPRCGRRLP